MTQNTKKQEELIDRFLADNPELEELTDRLATFNVFSALKIGKTRDSQTYFCRLNQLFQQIHRKYRKNLTKPTFAHIFVIYQLIITDFGRMLPEKEE